MLEKIIWSRGSLHVCNNQNKVTIAARIHQFACIAVYKPVYWKGEGSPSELPHPPRTAQDRISQGSVSTAGHPNNHAYMKLPSTLGKRIITVNLHESTFAI